MRKPRGARIHEQPRALRRRVEQLIEDGKPYKAIRAAIRREFHKVVSVQSLCRYYKWLQKTREERSSGSAGLKIDGDGANGITIRASGPLTIQIISAAEPKIISSK